MLGAAAVAIWCEVDPALQEEFDDWHSHEHMPERLGIAGFRRGSRWAAADAGRHRFMLYELEALETLTSAQYLERLNNPTPWSRKMMPHHQGMTRSLCAVRSTFGSGLADAMLTVRFSPGEATGRLINWLSAGLLPTLPMRKGLVAAHLLQNAASTQAAPTEEQRIRGGDRTADWIVLVNGYSVEALERLAVEELNDAALGAHGGAPGSIARTYRLAYTLTAADLDRAP
jgi:hypothetical protein